MEWTPDLSVGVGAIDEQHKELINRMNLFFNAIDDTDDKAKVLSMLDYLSDYVVTHFHDEEALQQRSGYPEYTAHKKLHEAFIADIEQLKADISGGYFTAATKMLMSTTLISWLTLHIKKMDKALAAHING